MIPRWLVAALLVVMPGCGDLLSVYPAGEGVRESWLDGRWECADKDCKGTAYVRAGAGADYDVVWAPGEADEEATRFRGRLVKIGGRLVLDLATAKRADFGIPGHFFLLVERGEGGLLKLHWLDSEWLREQARGTAHIVVDKQPVLTGDAGAFLTKFGLDGRAVSGTISFKAAR